MQHGAHDIRFALNALQLIDALGRPSLSRIQPIELSLMLASPISCSALVIAMCDGRTSWISVKSCAYQTDGARSYGVRDTECGLKKVGPQREGPAIYA